MIEWENGEITSEPSSVIAADDPVTCALCGNEHNLLNKPGWKRFKRLAKRKKKMLRMMNQDNLRSYRTSPNYKFGYELTRDKSYENAAVLHKKNGNNI